MKIITKKHTIVLIMALLLALSVIWIPDVNAQAIKEAEPVSTDAEKNTDGSGDLDSENEDEKQVGLNADEKDSDSTKKKSSKAESEIEINDIEEHTYDGKPVKLTKDDCEISGSKGKVKFTYYKIDADNSEKKTKLTNPPVDVGEYLVKAELPADDKYSSAKDECSFEITRANTNEWETYPDIEDYTLGQDPKPQAEAKFGKAKITYSAEADGDYTAEAPSYAGTWYMKAVVPATENYNGLEEEMCTFSVANAKTENEWTTELSIEGWTYGETPKTPQAAALYGDVTFSYGSEADGSFTENVPSNAGTWYVKASVAETDSYTGLTKVEEFVITKAKTKQEVYQDKLPKEAIEVDYGKTLKEITLPDGFAWEDGSQPVGNAGTKTFKAIYIPDDPQNYETVSGIDITVKVNKAANKWKKLKMQGWTWGEIENEPEAEAEHGEVTLLYSDKKEGPFTEEKPSEPGTWYIKAEVYEDANYTGLSDILEFKIEKAIPDYEVPEIKTEFGKELSEVDLPEGFTWEDDGQDVGELGKKKFKAIYTPEDTDHYKVISDIDITVEVKQAKNRWTQELSIEGWTYNTPNEPSAEAKYGEVIFVYSDKKDGNYTNAKPTDAGIWYVKAMVKETENYKGLISEPVQFEIIPKDGTKLKLPTITDDNINDFDITDGDTVLVRGTDYDVTTTQKGNKVTVTIKFKNNYRGKIIYTYTKKVTSSGTTATNKATNSKKTGDDTKLALYGSIVVLAGAIFVLVMLLRRKRQ